VSLPTATGLLLPAGHCQQQQGYCCQQVTANSSRVTVASRSLPTAAGLLLPAGHCQQQQGYCCQQDTANSSRVTVASRSKDVPSLPSRVTESYENIPWLHDVCG